MNEDRVVGTARNLGGKAQEGFGRVTGDTKSQVEGVGPGPPIHARRMCQRMLFEHVLEWSLLFFRVRVGTIFTRPLYAYGSYGYPA
jgi:hypothetical protein